MVVYICLALIFISITMFFMVICSYIRARNNRPYGIKLGMTIGLDGKLIGTETEIMTDSVTGDIWIGKTRYKGEKNC